MNKLRHKTIGLRPILAVLVLAGISIGGSFWLFQHNDNTYAYPASCVTDACHQAYDRAHSSQATANAFAEQANTLENEVAKLNAEISALEADIAMKQEIANGLAVQIEENQNKLNLQQAALAKLLVDMHFESETDAITLLASSESLGDLAEKQSRQNNFKDQVASSAEQIKTIKDDLENQKINMDALIASAEENRNQISAKRNQQNALRVKYENDSAAFERDAAAARETMQKEIAAEIARNNRGGTVGDGVNTYPWAANCPRDDSNYLSRLNNGTVIGGYVCQCTSYAGWKAYEYYGVVINSWGNAKTWGSGAVASGYKVSSTPAAHTVGYSTAGVYGHVVWIESVNSNGTVNLTEYNNASSSKSGLPGDFGARYNVPASAYRYIYFR